MAEVNIDLRLNQGNVRQGLRQVQGQIGQTNGVLNSFLGNLAADAFIGFARGAVTAFGDIFRSAIQIEQVGAQFRVLIGDAQQAEQALISVSNFAAGTPFENPEVERAATQLLAFGTTAAQLTERLTDLGNIAGVANRSISEIATIFGQVQAQGRLTLERFNQLAEGGVNLGNDLATRLAIPVEQVRDAITNGRVSAELFTEAIGALGDRFGGIEALANTLGGQLSTLSSNFELLRRNVGNEFTPALTDAVRAMNDAFAAIQPLARALARIAVNTVVDFFENVRDAINDSSSAFNRIRTFLIEHRGIIIRVATVYGIYTAAIIATRVATIAFGIATALINPAIVILRGTLLLTTGAVRLLSVVFLRLGGFLATTFTGILGILLTPIGAIGAAIVALGVVGTGFSSDLAVAFVIAQRAGVQLAQAFSTTGIVIEAVFREVAGSILEFIAPALQRITGLLSSLIRRIPSVFRPAALDNFANSLDNINFTMMARDLKTGESGLFAFNQELARSDQRLETLQTQLEATASNTSFGEQLSTTFTETLDNLQSAAVNNEFLGPIISQIQSFRMGLSDIPTDGIASFVAGGRGLLTSLQEALVNGEIPTSLQNLVQGSIDTVQAGIMQIEDENSRAEKRAAEADVVSTTMKNQRAVVQTAKEVTELMRKNQMIANIRLTAMEQIEIMEAEARIAQIESDGIQNEEDITRLAAAEQAKIDLMFRFANLRAMNETNASTRAVQIEQAQANQTVAIAKRASEERMRIAAAEQRTKAGFQSAADMLIQAGLQSERLGATERKALLVTQAVINTYAGASRAFADYPYPASAAVAGATIVAGLVQVDNILNAGSFQNGGVVGGSSFSGDRLQANVNSGEAILTRQQGGNVLSRLNQAESQESMMEARLASIERLLSQPTIIQNANGQMFAEITREGIRDGVDING